MADIAVQLKDALRDRYLLEHELRRGGMATVYLAREVHHRQPVAIKVLHPALATAIDRQRFVREMGIAASLAHPLIVPLYDSGNVGGVPYYVMPYVEGDSLYERLQRDRRLSLEDALQITHDLAAALGYAHTRGVLHRDVKPENILLAGGHALVADFGLARAIGAADYKKLTETGVTVGTVYYMSPEQVRADRDLDQRADIYSLGCILYEMLTGELPYTFQLRYLQTATEVAAEHSSTTIFPIPIELFRPFIQAAATGVATPTPPQIKVEGSAALPPQLQNVLTPGEGEAGGGGSATAANAMRGQLVRAPHYFT